MSEIDPDLTESQADFARRLNVSRKTITVAKQAGRLVMRDGMVLVAASLARYHATAGGRADVAARHAAERGNAIPMLASAATGAVTSPETAGNEQIDADRTRYKAIALHADNQLVKLEMQQAAGQRFPLESVKHEALGVGGTLRAAIERLIDHTAPRLVATLDQAERRRIVAAEVDAIRTQLRAEFPRALRRLRRAKP
ncbi:hypothetical protein N8I74_10990 [Chitiniphilus purpureus]|uniref:Terminase small subunit n=1 Tax=Chitiniphilus purpureus TaxID=2981137 RepID=A0ABY6DII9_9NEIS|nr:hypothetical protein [Chitiniphilus sp. CD1]UXY13847.1 hypothetical protein N8I74_10990 [Chitiniphilus sp. CD1]